MKITIIATGFEKKDEDKNTVAAPVVTEPVKRPASAEKNEEESPEVPTFEAPAAPAPAPAPAQRPQYVPQAPTYDVPGYNSPAEGAPVRAEGGIMAGETVGDEEFDEMIKMLRNGSRRRDDFRGRR